MAVDPATAVHRHEHDGEAYYFCCAGCLRKFSEDPARYLAPQGAPAPVVIGGASPPWVAVRLRRSRETGGWSGMRGVCA